MVVFIFSPRFTALQYITDLVYSLKGEAMGISYVSIEKSEFATEFSSFLQHEYNIRRTLGMGYVLEI